MSEVTNIETGKVKLTFDLPAEEYVKALDSAYHRIGSRYPVQGFRNGKAPRHMIEKNYGADCFWDRELELAIDMACAKAASDENLSPAMQPSYTVKSFSETEGCVIEAEIVLEPVVTLGEYKGIEVPLGEYNVTDEMVEKELEDRRHQQARLVAVDRPVELGDTVRFDFAGFLGDEQFEGGTAENHTMVIGSHQFIPGFEEQMVGMKADEERDINVTFPEDYHAEHLAGKPVVFKVRVHEVSYEELPELNDDFAADTSDFDTLDELKADIRRELEKQKENEREAAFEGTLLQKVIDNAKVEYSEELMHAEAHEELHHLEEQLAQFGASIEDFANSMGATVEEVHENYHKRADDQIRARSVIQAIINEEKLEPIDADYESAIKAYGSRDKKRPLTEDEIAEELKPENRRKYAQAALYDAVVRVLKESAVVVKKEEKEEEDK